MYCFNVFRNQSWRHLISYNSFRNVNMCLLEVAMSEKCRSSHFQSEGGVKCLRTGGGLKTFRTRGLLLLGRGGGQYPITCHEIRCRFLFVAMVKFGMVICEACLNVMTGFSLRFWGNYLYYKIRPIRLVHLCDE